jgi:hypothetical protein
LFIQGGEIVYAVSQEGLSWQASCAGCCSWPFCSPVWPSPRAGQAQGPPILINEVLVGNLGQTLDSDYTNFSSWIELRNTTGAAINIKGYKLVSLPDGAGAAQTYTLPKNLTILGGGYVLIWADGIGKTSHPSFELDMDGGDPGLDNGVEGSWAAGAQNGGTPGGVNFP